MSEFFFSHVIAGKNKILTKGIIGHTAKRFGWRRLGFYTHCRSSLPCNTQVQSRNTSESQVSCPVASTATLIHCVH